MRYTPFLFTDDERARFLAKCDHPEHLDNPDFCVLWTGHKVHNGYVQFWLRGKMVLAHRATLADFSGWLPDPKDYDAAHRCRNRHCVNPVHLSWKSRKENCADQIRDGTVTRLQGERNGQSRLTEKQVRAIRSDTRTQRAIARDYNISETQVRYIKRQKRWRHLE